MAEARQSLGGPSLDRGVARRQAFLRVAREMFLAEGYEAACVNDVVRVAGGSLATLYAQFGNKEGLFLAVIEDQHERFVRAMTPAQVDHLGLEEGLRQIGEQFLRTLLARDNIALFRIVVGEGRKFPGLLGRHLGASAERVRDVVTAHLVRTAPDCSDPSTVASYFLEMLRSRHHHRALADDDYSLSDAELRTHVANAARFLSRALNAQV